LKAFAYQGSAYIKDAISEADIDEYVRHYAAPGGMTAGFEYYRAFPQDAQDNQELGKQKLMMPVLALDAEYGFGGNIATMETLATNVQGVIVPNSGHWIAEEQPQYLISQVLEFLSKN
jgi:pimeloyl-ACP methyl ester carboxylesterase